MTTTTKELIPMTIDRGDEIVALMHRWAICQRDARARVTALGADYDGDLHVDDIVEIVVADDECAVLTVGRALLRSHGDDWTVAA